MTGTRIPRTAPVRRALAAGLLSLAAGCASLPAPEAVNDLAPGGKMRAAINLGNPILASKDAASGELRGVSVDLARELARRLGVAVELVPYTAAGRVVDGVKTRSWDIAFVAIDPARAVDIAYSPPYVVIEGAYMVRNDSPITDNAEVDRKGNRVAVGRNSAYDLFLKRTLKEATLVQAPTSPAVVDMFMAQRLEVAAGVRQQLEMDAKRVPGVRMLPGRFMVINQAMGTPRDRAAGAAYLRTFVEEMKSSGFVADALARHRIEGAGVAPPGP